MFGKNRREKKKNLEVAEVFTLQEEYSKQIEDKFAALDDVKDPAEKILKVQELINDIRNADLQAYNRQARIASRRARKRTAIGLGAGAVTAAAAVAVPAAILAPHLLLIVPTAAVFGVSPAAFTTNKTYSRKLTQLMEQNPKLKDFGEAMKAQISRAEKLLAESIKVADLKEISLSPRFKLAFDANQALRDRFAAAATQASKEELKEKPAPQKRKPSRQRPSYENLNGL